MTLVWILWLYYTGAQAQALSYRVIVGQEGKVLAGVTCVTGTAEWDPGDVRRIAQCSAPHPFPGVDRWDPSLTIQVQEAGRVWPALDPRVPPPPAPTTPPAPATPSDLRVVRP